MKTLSIASILTLSAALTFACGDDDTATTPNGAGGEGVGGERSAAGGAGGTGATDEGGAGGAPAEVCELVSYGEGGAGGEASSELEVIGTWEEDFVGAFEITSSYWSSSGIAAYDSDANVVYTQSPCDAEYNPGRFSKIVYTEPADDAFYYCTVVYDAKTLAEAQASEASADPEDLEAGCGASGFPWSKATKVVR